MNGIVQSISSNIYDVLSIKILQGSDAASGTLLQKRCSRIYETETETINITTEDINKLVDTKVFITKIVLYCNSL